MQVGIGIGIGKGHGRGNPHGGGPRILWSETFAGGVAGDGWDSLDPSWVVPNTHTGSGYMASIPGDAGYIWVPIPGLVAAGQASGIYSARFTLACPTLAGGLTSYVRFGRVVEQDITTMVLQSDTPGTQLTTQLQTATADRQDSLSSPTVQVDEPDAPHVIEMVYRLDPSTFACYVDGVLQNETPLDTTTPRSPDMYPETLVIFTLGMPVEVWAISASDGLQGV